MITVKQGKPWPTKCRCGQPLSFSCEDVGTGQPAEGADYWCSVGDPELGPHDWGVVVYRVEAPKPKTHPVTVAS
jgi:hypothetical protein